MIEFKLKAKNCNRGQLFSQQQLPTIAILGFQFGLYHVVAPLSFPLSISLELLFASNTEVFENVLQTVDF